MLVLFIVPQEYFVAATILSTSCMMVTAFVAGGLVRKRPSIPSVAIGVASAVLLYGVFYVGAWTVASFHPLGITSVSESKIYSLISSPSNPLYVQVAVLLFDSAGYESLFRGVLQAKLTPRLGVMAALAVASLDAALHLATLNLLWVGATLVADFAWGLTYHYGRGAQSSFTSHLVWDLAIFVLHPIT